MSNNIVILDNEFPVHAWGIKNTEERHEPLIILEVKSVTKISKLMYYKREFVIQMCILG